MFVYGCYFVLKELSEGVAEFLGGGDVVLCGCWVGELSDNAKEFFAVIGAVCETIVEGLFLGIFQLGVVFLELF